MESNYTKLPPRGSKYTVALKTWLNSFQNLHTNLVKKISVPDSIFRNSTHKCHI